MTRDHAIRIAVRGLAGKKREMFILRLAKNPDLIHNVLQTRMVQVRKRRWGIKQSPLPHRQVFALDAWATRKG